MSNVRMSKLTPRDRLEQARKLADLAFEAEEPAILRNIVGQLHGLLVKAEEDLAASTARGAA